MNDGKFRRRVTGGLLAVAVAWPLCACQSVSESQTASLVRVVDASYNAPAVDVYAGKTKIAKDVQAGKVSKYAILGLGPGTISGEAPGTKTPPGQLKGGFEGGGPHSV